jgi:hypothetical protein
VRVLSRSSLRPSRPRRRSRRTPANQTHQQKRTNNQRCLHYKFSYAMSFGAKHRPRRRFHVAAIIPTRTALRCPNPHSLPFAASCYFSPAGLFPFRPLLVFFSTFIHRAVLSIQPPIALLALIACGAPLQFCTD